MLASSKVMRIRLLIHLIEETADMMMLPHTIWKWPCAKKMIMLAMEPGSNSDDDGERDPQVDNFGDDEPLDAC